MAIVLSHIIFVEANPRFQTGCQTRLSRYPQSSLLTLDAPRVLSLSKLRPSMFVLVKRRMRQRGRLPLQFLRRIIARWVSISLPSRLGQVTSLIFPLRVTKESEEHDVSGLYFVIARSALFIHPCFAAPVLLF